MREKKPKSSAEVRDSSKTCFCFCRRKKQGKYWVNDEFYGKPPEQEGLVPDEKPDQNEKAIEMNNFSKKEEVEEPLLTLESQPEVEDAPPPPPEEHVYAKVDKSKKDRNSSEISEPRTRLYSGLTRAEVIRMAKKSDASKDEAKQFESPQGSQEELFAKQESPTVQYTPINQEELDEELKQFRTFFAQRQSKKFSSHSSPTTVTSKTTTTTITTTKVIKKGAKDELLENGPDDVFENGIEGSTPSSPVEKPDSPSPQEPAQIQTSVKQETHVEETITTSVVVRGDDFQALDMLVASEEGAVTRTDDNEESPPDSRPEDKDTSLFLDDWDLLEVPAELPSTTYSGDAIDEDEITSTVNKKEENMPDFDILETTSGKDETDTTTETNKDSEDLTAVTETDTTTETNKDSEDLTAVTETDTTTETTAARDEDETSKLLPPSETEI